MSNDEVEEMKQQMAYEVQQWLHEKIHSQKSTAVAMAILPIYDAKGERSHSVTPSSPLSGSSTNTTTKSHYFNHFDVIAGNGSVVSHHMGNIRYRKLINDLVGVYCTGTNEQKNAIVNGVFKIIASHGGRFLKKDNITGHFLEMSHTSALLKIKAALHAKSVSYQDKITTHDVLVSPLHEK